MTAISLRLRDAFGLEHVQLEKSEIPAPGPGQILVEIRAASLNYRDLMVVRGQYNPKQHLPVTLGSDGSGVVLAVGAGVTRFTPGDRVTSLFFEDWIEGQVTPQNSHASLGAGVDGVFCTHRIFPEHGLIATSPHLTDEEAATLPCAGLTAWNALMERGRLQPGETVLTLGTGGVSLFALQFATAIGATVVSTSSSDEKLERVKNLGAHHLVNYRDTPEWDKKVLDCTSGMGIEHVVEVGGPGTLPLSLNAVRYGGKVYLIGVLSEPQKGVQVLPVLMKSVQLHGIFVGSAEMFGNMIAFLEQHQIRPVIDRIFPFQDAVAALEHMASGSHFGKIVLRM